MCLGRDASASAALDLNQSHSGIDPPVQPRNHDPDLLHGVTPESRGVGTFLKGAEMNPRNPKATTTTASS